MTPKRLIIVANRLPFSIDNEGEKAVIQPASGGLVSAIRGFIESSKDEIQFSQIIWCGNPGCKQKLWDSLEIPKSKLYQYLPVFSSNKLYNDFYNGFSNSTLWPLFHYFPSYSKFNDTYWNAYQQMNDLFQMVLEHEIQEGDVVWIHDYHLMLLPALLRNRFPDLSIGFFLHIPFPTYELIKFIPNPWHEAILKGLLGADLIGFHTTEYVAHFLETIQSTLGITHQGLMIPYGNRYIMIDQFPISIHFEEFNSVFDNKLIQLGRKKLRDYFNQQRILFSIDRLDYTKGISNRIQAYESFLKKYPEYQKKIVFILVIIPSRDKIDKYEERKKMIDEAISRVNSSLGSLDWQPIIYRYRSLNFDELLTLYTSADVALITPIRDGMNLVAKEFIASRADKRGVLILSELAGAAKELQEAILINPSDIHDLSDKIKLALEISEEDQEASLTRMQNRIKKFDIKNWSSNFLQKLFSVTGLKQQLNLEIDQLTEHEFINFFDNDTINILIFLKSSNDLNEVLSYFKSIQHQLKTKTYIHIILDDKKGYLDKYLRSNNISIHQLHNIAIPEDHFQLNKSLLQLKNWFEDYNNNDLKIEIKHNKLSIEFDPIQTSRIKSLLKSIQKNLQLNHLNVALHETEIIFESNSQSIKHQLLKYILSFNKKKLLLIGISKEEVAYLLENLSSAVKLYSIQKNKTATVNQLKSVFTRLINK